jgi:hypothetical protein
LGLTIDATQRANARAVAPKPAIHAATTVPPGSSATNDRWDQGPVIDMARAEAKPGGES